MCGGKPYQNNSAAHNSTSHRLRSDPIYLSCTATHQTNRDAMPITLMLLHRRKRTAEREDTRRGGVFRSNLSPNRFGREAQLRPSLTSLLPSPLPDPSQVSTQFPDCPGRLLNHLGTSPKLLAWCCCEHHLDSFNGHCEIRISDFSFFPTCKICCW